MNNGIRLMSDASVRSLHGLAVAREAPATQAAIERELNRRGLAVPVAQPQLRSVA